MKKLLIVLIVLSACKKQPVKECWTVESCKIVQVVPSVYEVTWTWNGRTKVTIQSNLPLVGSNTCGTGERLKTPF